MLGVQDACRGLCAVTDAACGNLPAGDWAPRASECRMVLGQLGWNQLRSLPSPCSLPLGGFVASEVSQPAWHGAASSARARVSQRTLEQSPTLCMLQLPRGSPAQEVPGGWSSFSCFCAPWAEHPQLPARLPGFSLWKSPAWLLLKSKVGENPALTDLAGSSWGHLGEGLGRAEQFQPHRFRNAARGRAGGGEQGYRHPRLAHGRRGCAGLRPQPSEPAAASPLHPELLGSRQGHRSLPRPRRPPYLHGESLC